MKEERVTKLIIRELDKDGFTIIAFDYPQSGTGVLLIPNINLMPRINFDIIAIKHKKLYLFENKDRYYPKDFEKLFFFKKNIMHYADSFEAKFKLNILDFEITTIIGLPEEYLVSVKKEKRDLVDKIWGIKNDI